MPTPYQQHQLWLQVGGADVAGPWSPGNPLSALSIERLTWDKITEGTSTAIGGQAASCPSGSVLAPGYFGVSQALNCPNGLCYSGPREAGWRDNRYPWQPFPGWLTSQTYYRGYAGQVWIPFPPTLYVTTYRYGVTVWEVSMAGIRTTVANWYSPYYDDLTYNSRYGATGSRSIPVILCPPEALLCGDPWNNGDWCCLDCAAMAADVAGWSPQIEGLALTLKQKIDQALRK